MKARYYFERNNLEDGCFTLDYWKELSKEEERNIDLIGAKIVYGESFFWCSEYQDVGETSESCGSDCDKYTPRNGKNGRCKFHKNTYEANNEIEYSIKYQK